MSISDSGEEDSNEWMDGEESDDMSDEEYVFMVLLIIVHKIDIHI